MNQNLGTHQTQEIFEGTAIVTVTTNLGTTQPLLATTSTGATATVSYAQPFTMSGTEIDRIVLPLSMLNGIGADVTVQLYNDSSGAPGTTASGAYVLPREFIQLTTLGTSNSIAYQAPQSSSWTLNSSIALPTLFAVQSNFATAFDGTYVTAVQGTAAGTGIPSTVYTALVIGGTTGNLIGPWIQQPSLLVNSPNSGVIDPGIVASSAAGVVILVGGLVFGGGNNTVYTSGIAGGGTLGVWQQQTNYPVNIDGNACAVVGPATTGSESGLYRVYSIGGSLNVGAATNQVYSSAIQVNAAWVWRTETSYPITVKSASIAVINGWLVVAGGVTATNAQVFAARINSDNTIGPWITWPSLPVGVAYPQYGTFGNLLITAGGTNSSSNNVTTVQALPVTANGPGSWVQLASLNAVIGSGNVGQGNRVPITSTGQMMVFHSAAVSAQGEYANFSSLTNVSVPLRVTGLTNSTKYHVVVSQVTSGFGGSNSPSDTVGILVGPSVSGGGGFTALKKVGSGAWVTLASGSGIPMTIYQGSTGRPIHYLEDVTNNVPARQTWLVFDAAQGNGSPGLLRGIGEAVGNLRSFKTLVYTPDGTIAYTGSPAGAGFMVAGYSPGGVSLGANPGGVASSTFNLYASGTATTFTATTAVETSTAATTTGNSINNWTGTSRWNGLTISDNSPTPNSAAVTSATISAGTLTVNTTTWSPSTPAANKTFTITTTASGTQNAGGLPVGAALPGGSVAGSS